MYKDLANAISGHNFKVEDTNFFPTWVLLHALFF